MEAKDKIAFVLHGMVGYESWFDSQDGRNGTGGPADMVKCAKTIKHNILSLYDSDVFIHSWSIQDASILKDLYNPTDSIFENNVSLNMSGQAYNATSSAISIERGVKLKRDWEIKHNFTYKWVFISRLDLIVFNKIDMYGKDNDLFYTTLEPMWGIETPFIFVSNSKLMDEYSYLGHEILEGKYNPAASHQMISDKLNNMFNNDTTKYRNFIGGHPDTVEFYRYVNRPKDPNSPIRLEALLNEIDSLKTI